MTYALGRGVQYYDLPNVRKIVKDAARDNYRFSTIVKGIITAPEFRSSAVESVEAPQPGTKEIAAR